MIRALLRALLALCLVALLAAGGLYLWARQWIETPVAGLQAPVAFEVARGATLRSVARWRLMEAEALAVAADARSIPATNGWEFITRST